MGKGSNGMTRGDRRRNARRERLRELLPREGAVIGIDLAEDRQALAVADHDGRVLARRTVRVKAFRLGEALDWAAGQARAAGFSRVTVACEPTGPRWMQVQRLCQERGLPLVCVQPLVSHIAREQQDYTAHKTDESDAVLIARLACELHCYIPEVLDEDWAHLRHLGRRREQLITAQTASVQRVRDFLSVAWPAVTEACADPFRSVTWLAAVQAVVSWGGGPGGPGLEELTGLARAGMPAWGGQRPCLRVLRAVHAALAAGEGVVASSRRGLFRRIAGELEDLARVRGQLRTAGAEMTAVLEEDLGLSRLGGIPGLTVLGAAVILAETGDPFRYDSSSSMVKHAGMSPARNSSGAFEGQARISRRGRPLLRLAVWRAVWPMLTHNPVLAAKYAAMTAGTAPDPDPAAGPRTAAAAASSARRGKARVACAASLLRWIWCLVVHGTDWDPAIASGTAPMTTVPARAA